MPGYRRSCGKMVNCINVVFLNNPLRPPAPSGVLWLQLAVSVKKNAALESLSNAALLYFRVCLKILYQHQC